MKLVHILLDETGSMTGMKQEAIDGVNDYLDKIADVSADEDVTVSLTKFDSKGFRSLMEEVPIAQAIRLNAENYSPDAMTNLFDAIGHIIRQTGTVQKRMTKTFSQVPVFVLIVTDGGENASRELNRDAVNSLIKEHEGEGWTFLYVGASQDAWQNERAYAGTKTASNVIRSAGSVGLTAAFAAVGDSYASFTDAANKDMALGNKVMSYNVVTQAQKEEVAKESDGAVTLAGDDTESVTDTDAAINS